MTPSTQPTPNGYRLSQIAVHWIVFGLVAFMFFTGDYMTDAWRAMTRSGATTWTSPWVPIHIVGGLLVFALMLARLALRRRYGAPPPPADEAPALRFLAVGVHHLLYFDLLVAPLVGLAAYFLFPKLGGVHEFLVRLPIIVLVGLHVVGALYHRFVLRSGVAERMLWPISG